MKKEQPESIKLNKPDAFAENLIAKVLENGFGSLPKRELEIYIMHLLLADGQFAREDGEIDFHEMSLALRMTEARVRNLVYEVELKYGQNIDFIQKLIEIIEQKRFEVSGDTIRFAVHNPLLRQVFEYEVRQLNAVSDGSFARHVVTIKRETFARLLEHLFRKAGREEQLAEIIEELPGDQQERVLERSLFQIFSQDFVSAFSSKSGKRAADLIFDYMDPVGMLKRLFAGQ